ncbi:hypothetical protein BH18ACI1_BH18ACI1_02890 [soil metagenome]
MQFYADENFPLDVVTELRNLGNDILTALEDERANQKITGEKVLNFREYKNNGICRLRFQNTD